VEIVSDRRYRMAADVRRVWAALTAVDEYPRWWPWLREFEASSLAVGEDWRCAVRPPLPYVVRFTVSLVGVVEAERIDARVDGDIAGDATVLLSPVAGGSEVRLSSRLTAAGRGLAVLAVLARPVVARAHDWIIDTGARQFADRAI
jgi:uncharacterized protein YndB with AHSA1/START domain